jgi:hypothetical protein
VPRRVIPTAIIVLLEIGLQLSGYQNLYLAFVLWGLAGVSGIYALWPYLSKIPRVRLVVERRHEKSVSSVSNPRKPVPESPTAAAIDFSPDAGFDETTTTVLRIFFRITTDVSAQEIASALKVPPRLIEYHFGLLHRAKFIQQATAESETVHGTKIPAKYALTDAGLAYVVKNKL